MQDYIDIGSSPSDEKCAQVGDTGYFYTAKVECRAFKNQLIRTFGDPKKYGCMLCVKANPHDFGDYYEVVCYFETTNPISLKYALTLENMMPRVWDEQALKEISEAIK